MSNTYPQGPGQQYTPPPPPKKKRTGLKVVIILGVIALAMIILIGSCSAFLNSVSNNIAATPPEITASDGSETTTEPSDQQSEDEPSEKAKPPYEIKATECTRGDYGNVDVKVKVINNSNKKRTYIFDIAVEDEDGNTVGSGFGSIANVKPGKTGTAGVYASMTDEEYDGKIKCVIEVTDF